MLLLLLALGTASLAKAQADTTASSAKMLPQNPAFRFVERMPEFPGVLNEFVRKHIQYPESALHERITGKVYLQFIVEADGSLTNAQVLRGINDECNQEALRLVSLMPKWKPGKQNGQAVRVYVNLPISFQLEEKE